MAPVASHPPTTPPDPAGSPTLRRVRLWRQAGVLLVLLALLDVLVAREIEPLVLADTQAKASTGLGRVALYHHADPPPEVLLMGSSRVECDLSPSLLMNRARDAFGQTPSILNLGLAGGTPQANYWLLKNVVSAAHPPRLIIYGTSEYEFNPNGGRIPPDNYADELATLDDFRAAFPDPTQHIDGQLSFLLGQAWHLFRYRNDLHDTLFNFAESADGELPSTPDSVQDSLGFLPLNHEMRPVDIRKLRDVYTGRPGHLQDYTVQGYQATRFEQLIALAQARGTRVIIINMPITTVHEAFLSPADYESYRAYLRGVSARFGVPFFDYNDHSLWQEPGDFADTNHMNRVGAKKLSQFLSRDVLIPALRDLGY